MIDGCNIFDQRVKHDIKTYKTIKKITAGNRDKYTTGCMLDYPYFKKNYKMIAIDLSKQQVFDVDPKTIL